MRKLKLFPIILLMLLLIASGVHSAQQTIVETDTLGEAWTKQNANNTELYNGTNDSITESFVPYKAASGTLEDIPIHWSGTPGDDIIFDEAIDIPPGTMKIGEGQSTSAIGVIPLWRSALTGYTYTGLMHQYDETGSTSNPFTVNFAAETDLVKTTGTDSVPLTGTIPITTTATEALVEFQFLSDASTTVEGFRVVITSVATGEPVYYFPSKAEYLAGTGQDVVADGSGVVVMDIREAPLGLLSGLDLTYTYAADAGVIKGSGTTPALTIVRMIGTLTDLIVDDGTTTRVQTTGLLEGGEISIASSTTVDWTSGRGLVTNYTNPEIPIVSDVSWNANAGQTITNIATDGTTLFGYDSTGSIVQKLSTTVSIEDSHDTIFFGSVTHLSGAVVAVITAPGNIAYDGVGSFSDFVNLVIGPANIDGNVYGPNGSNMNIDVVGGNAYMIGSNFRNDPALADIITLANETTVSFQKVYKTAGAGLSVVYDGAPTTTIDPSSWDDGDGTLATTTTDYFTIQRFFRSRTGNTFVAYGQEEFATKEAAVAALGKESFTEKSPLPFTLYRTALIVQEGATDLEDEDEAEFFTQSSFRLIGAQSASATIPGVTSPGGSDGNIQYNSSSTFGGDSNFTYDDTLKTVVLQAPAAGSATYEFVNSSDIVKGVLRYAETADEFSISATGTTSEIHLNDAAWVHRGTIDGRIDTHSITSAGCALLTLSNFAGGTGLSLEHDDATDESIIDSEIGNLTLKTTTASTDIVLNPTGDVGVKKPDPDSVLHIYEDTTESGIQAGLTIEQDGTGDAITQYSLTGGQKWVTGLDNSGSDAFKIASSLDLASNAQLVLETDGRSEFLGKLGVNKLPSSIIHVYEDTAEVGATAGLTIEQDGVGDAVAQFLTTGGQRWVMGIDNSFDDNFVFAKSADLNSNQQLVLQEDGKNNFYGTLGIGKVPDDNFRLDVATTVSTKVGLSSFKAVTIEAGKNGSGNSTDLFFNRGNVGFNQSEFTMYNDNNASGPARMFRMGYSDDIDTSGGLTVWKTRNNVAVGTYTQPDSVLTVSEDTTETGDQAGLTIIQEGSGDAVQQYLLDGGQRWVSGIDNSGNDAYKIASSINLGTNDMLVLEPDAGMFLYSHTDDVLTLGNSTGETSKISIDDAGDPEGVVTSIGGDVHVNTDGVSSRMALKKSAGSSTTDWYDVALVPPAEKVIYNTTELEAMATAGVITVSSSTTWKIKGHLDSDTRIVLTNRAQLHIVTDNSNQASWTYSGTGDFISGTGGFRSLEFMDFVSSSTGTMFNLDLDGRSVNLTLAGLFDWDNLGSLSNGTLIIDVSDIFDNAVAFDLTNTKITVTQSNFANTPTTALPFFTVDNSFTGKSINVTQLSGDFVAGSTLFRIEPALHEDSKTVIAAVTTTGNELFDTSGTTGDFSAVADVSVTTETITSVTDSSGVARFNFSAPPTLFVNQEVIISGYGTRTNFNGTYIITATGAGYFEVASIDYEAGVDSGSFISNSVTVTDTGTSLVDGDQIVIDTFQAIDYDGGAIVYNQLTNTFQINRTYTATHSGVWSQAGLDQTDYRVLAHDNPGSIDSKYIGFGHIEENPIVNITSIGAADTYQAIDITGTTGFATIFATNGAGGTTCTSTTHGLVENQNIELVGGDPYYDGVYTLFNVTGSTFDIAKTFQATALTSIWNAGFYCDNERFKCTNPATGEMTYTGSEPFTGSAKITWTTLKTGSAANYIFSIGKNGIVPNQGGAYQKRSVTTTASVHPVTTKISLVTGDTVQPIVAGVGTTNDILIENLQMRID